MPEWGPIRPVAIILSDKGDLAANRTVRLVETQAQVYESVADETGRPVESIRKIFEENDRNAGPFSIRRVREAKKRGGISEL